MDWKAVATLKSGHHLVTYTPAAERTVIAPVEIPVIYDESLTVSDGFPDFFLRN
jgi:hypothetical protein